MVSLAGQGGQGTAPGLSHLLPRGLSRARGPHLLPPSLKERAWPAFHSKGTDNPRWAIRSSAPGRQPLALARGEGTEPRWSLASPVLRCGRDLSPGCLWMEIKIALAAALQTPAEPAAPCPGTEAPPGPPRRDAHVALIQFSAQTQKLAPNVQQPDTACDRPSTDSAGQLLLVWVCFQATEAQADNGSGPRREPRAQKRVGPAGRKEARVYLYVLGRDPHCGGDDRVHGRREGAARPRTPALPFKETLEQIAPQKTSVK